MQRSPFHQYHADQGASFVDFAGWEMPIRYGSIHEEHRHVREAVGLFDVSHMGRFKISGRSALGLLERVLTRRISDMAEHTCRYSLICNEAGGVLDDVLVYRFSDHWALVVNASNRAKIGAHLQSVAGDDRVRIDDQTEVTAMVALQGPRALALVAGFSREVATLKRYAFCIKKVMFLHVVISRTGYSGEDGVEVIVPAKAAVLALKVLAGGASDGEHGVRPCGLGARDTLRLEAGMPLYGHELDEQTDPLSAGLGFAVDLDKGAPGGPGGPGAPDTPGTPGFIGQDALQGIAARGLERKRVGLRLEGKRTARQGMAVKLGGERVGQVTSGCLSPTLGYPIAMAYVSAECAEIGTAVAVELGSKAVEAQVVGLPFYKRS